jgi:hypothetical protein
MCRLTRNTWRTLGGTHRRVLLPRVRGLRVVCQAMPEMPPDEPDYETVSEPENPAGNAAGNAAAGGHLFLRGKDARRYPGENKTAGRTLLPARSAGKSAPGRPFTGTADRRNRQGPLPGAPNSGRPPSAVREAMRLSAASRISVLEGKADDAGASPADRIRAVDTTRPHRDRHQAGSRATRASGHRQRGLSAKRRRAHR